MKLAFFLTLVSLIFTSEHPIYVSVTNMDYKPKEQRLEIGIKIFADDLEHALEQIKGERIEIATEREHPKATIYIQEYLKKHFQLSIDKQPFSYQYIGREVDDGDFFAIWIYLLVDKVPENAQTLVIKNSLLIKFFKTQNNIITFRKGKTAKRFSLYDGSTSTSIPLN